MFRLLRCGGVGFLTKRSRLLQLSHPSDDYTYTDPCSLTISEGLNPEAQFLAASVLPEPVKGVVDPINWDTEQVIEWILSKRADVDPDIIDAFRYSKVTGKALLDLTPPEMFKLMRKSLKKGQNIELDDMTIQSTVVACFKYGRG